MSDLKWYSIQMIDGVSCERSAFNLSDLIKEVNKFMRNHTYHEDEILTINYLGDEWQATPMKQIQEEGINDEYYAKLDSDFKKEVYNILYEDPSNHADDETLCLIKILAKGER